MHPMPTGCAENWTLRRRLLELHPRAPIAGLGLGLFAVVLTWVHLFRNATNISHKDLWLDEASTYLVAQYPLDTLLWLPTEFHSQPPLYYLVLHYWSMLSSEPAVLRGLSWLFCLLLIYFVLLAVNQLSMVARVVLCVLLVFHPFTLYLSQELRPYALGALLAFVSSVLLLRAGRTPAAWRLACAYGLCALLMAYSVAFNAWTVAVHGLYVMALFGARARQQGVRTAYRQTRVLALVFGIVAAAYLPYVLLVPDAAVGSSAAWSERIGQAFSLEPYRRAFTHLLAEPWSPVALGLALYGVIRERTRGGLFWLVLVVGQIPFLELMLHDQRLVYPRYWAPVYPALLFMVALGVHHLSVRKDRVLQAIVLGCLLLSAAWFAPDFAAFARQPPPPTGWRTLSAELGRVEGNKVIFFRTGFYGQMLAYPARHDSSLTILTEGNPPPPGSRAGAGGTERLRAAFVEEKVRALAGETRCFFHATDKRRSRRRWAQDRVYSSTFVPLMAELGYRKAFELSHSPDESWYHNAYFVRGYCRRR